MDELLAEVKLYLRLDGDIEDALLTGMIKAADFCQRENQNS